MADALSIAEISMQNDLTRLKALSNNMANVGTNAYKHDLVTTQNFIDDLDRAVLSDNRVLLVPLPDARAVTNFSVGTANLTERPLDVMIEHAGFFEVLTDSGLAYTRQGNFKINENGVLVTAVGHVVNGEGGEISLTTSEPVIRGNGDIIENDVVVGSLKVVAIDDLDKLVKAGSGLYLLSEEANVREVENISIRQGHLESHNMNMTQEMINLIEVKNHFQASQRVVQSYDEMLDQAINVLGDF